MKGNNLSPLRKIKKIIKSSNNTHSKVSKFKQKIYDGKVAPSGVPFAKKIFTITRLLLLFILSPLTPLSWTSPLSLIEFWWWIINQVVVVELMGCGDGGLLWFGWVLTL